MKTTELKSKSAWKRAGREVTMEAQPDGFADDGANRFAVFSFAKTTAAPTAEERAEAAWKNQQAEMERESERERESFARFEVFRAEGTSRQQSLKFTRWLKKNNIAFKKSAFWNLKGSSRYVTIENPDEDELDIEVRFANHDQANGGGFCSERQDRFGEATLSVDPVSGCTWQDATTIIEKVFAK